MNNINYIKVGGTTYQVGGSGGGSMYDAIFIYDMDSGDFALATGDYTACVNKIESHDPLNIVLFVTVTSGGNKQVSTYYGSNLEYFNSSSIVAYFYYDGMADPIYHITWTATDEQIQETS